MTAALLAVLPFALGVTMSGTAIVTLVRLLAKPQWKREAVAFAAGAASTVTLLFAIALVIIHVSGPLSPTVRATLTVLLGLMLVLLARRAWRRSHAAGHRWTRPKPAHPLQAAAIGAFLIGVNAKNIALIISAAAVLRSFRLRVDQLVVAAVVFIGIGVLGVVLPIVFRWKEKRWLDGVMSRVDGAAGRWSPVAAGAMFVVALVLIATGIYELVQLRTS